jgi:hypothetical protein
MATAAQPNFEILRIRVRAALKPIKPLDEKTRAKQDFLFSGKRAVGAAELPAPYLIYFLLVELLEYGDLGKFEKLAWSIPIDFEGQAFLIEHRKFGVGIFVQDENDIVSAKYIADLLGRCVQLALPYFKWKADNAVARSELNIINNANSLLGRFNYLLDQSKGKFRESEKRKDEVVKTVREHGHTINRPSYQLEKEANWLAISAIEAFYCWTEHLFVLISILNGSTNSGHKFAEISGANWDVKFKVAIDVSEPNMKKHYDKLKEIRRQIRNFIAHGSFGKNGEALHFHSNIGAVPVLIDITKNRPTFALGGGPGFNVRGAFETISSFVDDLKVGPIGPAWLYIHEYDLPLILTMAQDGSYQDAMKTKESMSEFADFLSGQMDNATNMDW